MERYDDVRAWAAAVAAPEAAVRRPRVAYGDVGAALAALADAPRARVSACGDSVRGEPIWRAEVGPESGEPAATVFVVAGLHAMEHVGVATALSLLERAAAPGSAWSRHRLVAVPLANPDGFRDVEAGLARGARRLWRKNAHGVDLNRNFAARWDDRYYLNRIVPRVFAPGPAPLSEPETRAVDAAFAEAGARYAVSLHAFGEWIFLPYAGSRERPPDAEALEAIADGMASRQPGRGYRRMQLARRSRLFRAHGAEIDHFHARGALSFLLEIGAGPRPSEPRSWLEPYAWFNPPPARLDRDVDQAVAAVEYLTELD